MGQPWDLPALAENPHLGDDLAVIVATSLGGPSAALALGSGVVDKALTTLAARWHTGDQRDHVAPHPQDGALPGHAHQPTPEEIVAASKRSRQHGQWHIEAVLAYIVGAIGPDKMAWEAFIGLADEFNGTYEELVQVCKELSC